MRRSTQLAIASLVAVSLAIPAEGWGQASRRGGSDSSSPSSGGSSGGSSGDSNPRSAGGDGGGSSASPRIARPRGDGGASSSGGSQATGSAGAPVTRSNSGSTAAGARSRGARASQGEAQPRQFWRPINSRPTYVIRSYYPSFGYYDPWYGYGYGYNRWSRYPYGAGLGVFGHPYGFYDPYYDPYGYGGYAGSYSRVQDEDNDRRPTGSIRVRANPRNARVYVDGALAGTVDEFDGLSDHLELLPGTHQLEIRADGFETYTMDVTVREGRTITARASLRAVN